MSGSSGGEENIRIALRHYTSTSGLASINQEITIRAGDRNRVFTVRARGNPLSQRDAERALGIKRGRGNTYVDFFASPSEFTIELNPLTGVTEYTIEDDVNLTEWEPSFHANR